MPMIICAERSTRRPTVTSGPTPSRASCAATRLARAIELAIGEPLALESQRRRVRRARRLRLDQLVQAKLQSDHAISSFMISFEPA